jgi:hypothetical protein
MLNQHPALAELRQRIRFLEGARVREGSVLPLVWKQLTRICQEADFRPVRFMKRSAVQVKPRRGPPLSTDAAAATYYVGPREIEFYRSDTGNYCHAPLRLLWIVLRRPETSRPFELHPVTAAPG